MVDYIKAKALATLHGFTLDGASSAPPPSIALDLATLPCGADEPPLAGCVLDGALSRDECARLVAAAESSGGFAYWDPAGGDARRSVRNADTLELNDEAFCAALWQRLAPFVPERESISPDDEQRYEPDLEGEWVATGLNPHLLINRYASGGHFAPHADGSTMVDFNRRSYAVSDRTRHLGTRPSHRCSRPAPDPSRVAVCTQCSCTSTTARRAARRSCSAPHTARPHSSASTARASLDPRPSSTRSAPIAAAL